MNILTDWTIKNIYLIYVLNSKLGFIRFVQDSIVSFTNLNFNVKSISPIKSHFIQWCDLLIQW